ncbi:hypothetical protein GIB67_012867 [Kingdonia uniflora]|uniref:Pentatricopeptide repeat-containing protein n=1 Tax=Kingdonia uniflora TaxID=39325 RepID=A0A7J7NG36_9MAGN|nr:hypothetical protein GIB67_030141 [Kingdonia uniflora]KAF6165970.1 hypothetical protein GIB67_012867 [Kingdonia uniflora]
MISSYVHHEFFEESLKMFEQMLQWDERPNQFTLSVTVRACSNLGFQRLDMQIHGMSIGLGFDRDEFAGSSLVDMYFKVGGCLDDAYRVFNGLYNRDSVTWNVMISGFAQVGETDEVMRLFGEMRVDDRLSPNDFTFSSLLNCCGCLTEVEQIHGLVLKFGTETEIVIGSVLVDLYGKCGSLNSSRRIMDSMRGKDSFTWSSIISSYARNGSGEEALIIFSDMCRQDVKPDQHALSNFNGMGEAEKVFRRISDRDIVFWNSMMMGYAQMGEGSAISCIKLYRELQQSNNLKPDEATMLAVLKSCQSNLDLQVGLQIHNEIVQSGQTQKTVIANAMISMYSKCGELEDSRKAFDTMFCRDDISWSSIIGNYVQNGVDLEALRLCKEMLASGVPLTCFSLPLCITACSGLAAMDMGKQFHVFVTKYGFKGNIYVQSSMLDMYAKCGSMEDSVKAFSEQENPNVVFFNALITGFTQHGKAREAINTFEKMEKMEIIPNKISFLALLSACGKKSWRTLLSACRNHGNATIGEKSAKMMMKLDPDDHASYVLLSNIYLSAGKWEEALELRQKMSEIRVKKDPGNSWLIVRDQVHQFTVGDFSHPEVDKLLNELNLLYQQLQTVD